MDIFFIISIPPVFDRLSQRTVLETVSLAGLADCGTILGFNAIDPFICTFFLTAELFPAEKNGIFHGSLLYAFTGKGKSHSRFISDPLI
jgi:hypothetical protein